ncbi:hypothetical protein BH23ACT4_BH23ACT4_02990 [soil metagenome]
MSEYDVTMAEGGLGRPGILLAVFAVVLAACNGANDVSETTRDETSTTRDTTERVTTTTERMATTTTFSVPESTTSTSSGITATPPDIGDGAIGVVGCSNTGQSVEGYHDVSDAGLLTSGDLGGGAISLWGDPSNGDYSTYWSFYDTRRPAEGYAGTWVQLCIRASEHQGAFDADEQQWVTHIVEQIQARQADIPIWISPLNFYADGVVCEAVGVEGPAISAETADWAASALPGVFRGPDLGPIEQSDLGVRDNCHLGRDGKALVGAQLSAFFD